MVIIMGCKSWCCLILMVCSFSGLKMETANYCTFMRQTSFDNCGSREAELKRYSDRNINRYQSSLESDEKKCNNTNICRSLFRTGRVRNLSFGARISVNIAEALRHCCGKCTKYHQINLPPPLNEAPKSVVNQLHLIFPVYSQSNVVEVHGLKFVAVLNIPQAYYFTLKESETDSIAAFLKGVSRNWPLLILCLSTCVISGFVVWILETWGNEAEFPRPFLGGLREGFWWGFISMTTVGYGDKAPRSLIGRTVAVGWIVFGITINSIYVSELTTEIMEVHRTKQPEIHGARVGVLKNRFYDSVMTLQHGGIHKEIAYNNTVAGVVEMIQHLENGTLDGFLITKPTFYYYSRKIKTKKYQYLRETIQHVNLDRTVKSFVEDKLVAGMLVRDDDDYMFLKRYFENNWLQIQGCYAADLSYKHQNIVHEKQNTMAILLVPLFIYLLHALIGIVCFGIIYEVIRWRTNDLERCTMKMNPIQEQDGQDGKAFYDTTA